MVFTEDNFSTTYCFTKYAVSKLCQIIIDRKSLCNSSRVRKRDVAYYTYYVSNLLLKVKQKIDWFTYLNLYENNDNRALFSVGNKYTEKDFRILLSPKISEGCAIIDQIIVPQIPNQNKTKETNSEKRKPGKTETENLKVEE